MVYHFNLYSNNTKQEFLKYYQIDFEEKILSNSQHVLFNSKNILCFLDINSDVKLNKLGDCIALIHNKMVGETYSKFFNFCFAKSNEASKKINIADIFLSNDKKNYIYIGKGAHNSTFSSKKDIKFYLALKNKLPKKIFESLGGYTGCHIQINKKELSLPKLDFSEAVYDIINEESKNNQVYEIFFEAIIYDNAVLRIFLDKDTIIDTPKALIEYQDITKNEIWYALNHPATLFPDNYDVIEDLAEHYNDLNNPPYIFDGSEKPRRFIIDKIKALEVIKIFLQTGTRSTSVEWIKTNFYI